MADDQETVTPTEELDAEKPDEPEKQPEVEQKHTLLNGPQEFNARVDGDTGVFAQGNYQTITQTTETHHHHYGMDRAEAEQIIDQRFDQLTRERRNVLFGESEASSNQKKVPGRRGRFEKKVNQDAAISDNEDDSSAKGSSLPATDADLAKWYRELSAYDKCFVQAMAIFDGASILEISVATRELYKPVKQSAATATSQQSSPSEMQEPADFILLEERLTGTHTKKKRIASTERLYWQDSDPHKISKFRLRVLHFIAQEVHMWSDSVFLDRLEYWAAVLTDENGPRATYALGVVWWHQYDRLQEIVNNWTRQDSPRWYRAAYVLDGVYDADRAAYGAAADDPGKSPVLRLVQKWVSEARFSDAINRGCAAALTYSLIGEQSPTLALRGLDSLLELPKPDPKSNKEPEGIDVDIYEAVVLSYVDIAVEGHLREVLDHLARRLELTSYRRLPLTDMKSHQRMHHRMQRQLQLLAALDAFSRIANRSFQNVKNRDWVNYTLDMSPPSSASLANSDGREILFVGLLTETWREQITTLLCAALIEKLDDFAFVLLRLWADMVLKDQGPTPDKVRSAYVGFVVGLDQMIRTWCKHLLDLGFAALSTSDRFRRKLEKWQKEGEQRHQPIGALAQEILEQIPC